LKDIRLVLSIQINESEITKKPVKFLSNLSRLEIYIKTLGAIVLLLGTIAVVYTIILFYGMLPESKYWMVVGFSIGLFLLYTGFVLFRFKQITTGHIIYEHEIL